MKLRYGFVSNSSSSSFIIVSKKHDVPKGTIHIDVNLNRYIRSSIENEEELRTAFIDDLYYAEEELEESSEYKECLEKIKAGYIIHIGHVSDYDDLSTTIKDLGINSFVFDEEVEIISDCE